MSNLPDELYQDYYSHHSRGGDGYIRPLAEVESLRLDRLPRWMAGIPRDARILDAGCAHGYVLGLLRGKGYTALTGVDISGQLTAMARQRLGDEVRIVTSDIQPFLAVEPEQSYDVILFHHVLEHIPREQTVDLLRQFHRCLKPGGYLSLRTPNANVLMAGFYCHCDFTHLVNFNERSLLQVLEAAGFDVNHVEFLAKPPLLFWSWHHPRRALLRALNRLRWHLSRRLHQAICLLLDLRPMPTVFDGELEARARR